MKIFIKSQRSDSNGINNRKEGNYGDSKKTKTHREQKLKVFQRRSKMLVTAIPV